MFNRIFNYNGRELWTNIDESRQCWFKSKDVCDVLGIIARRDAIARLDNDERGSVLHDTLGGKQKVSVVNESGLYHLIFQSRKAEAKKFRKWVTSEVLPSIRTSGSYIGKPSDEDKIAFINRIFPDTAYNEVSEKTGYRKIVAVNGHFRSCRIAKANVNQPDLFQIQEKAALS